MQKKYHLQDQPIPDGYRIYEDRVTIPGIVHHRDAAVAFCLGKEHRIELEADPGNPHDGNAIAIYGTHKAWFRDHRARIGYLPREVAATIAASQAPSRMKGRLLKTYVGDDGFVEIMVQVLGPAEGLAEYKKLRDARD